MRLKVNRVVFFVLFFLSGVCGMMLDVVYIIWVWLFMVMLNIDYRLFLWLVNMIGLFWVKGFSRMILWCVMDDRKRWFVLIFMVMFLIRVLGMLMCVMCFVCLIGVVLVLRVVCRVLKCVLFVVCRSFLLEEVLKIRLAVIMWLSVLKVFWVFFVCCVMMNRLCRIVGCLGLSVSVVLSVCLVVLWLFWLI